MIALLTTMNRESIPTYSERDGPDDYNDYSRSSSLSVSAINNAELILTVRLTSWVCCL
jgi:hypothetical protein